MALIMWRVLSFYWAEATHLGACTTLPNIHFSSLSIVCLCLLGFSVQLSNNEVFYCFTTVLAKISSMLFKSIGQV